jgi:DNA adenine methylase
MGASEVPGRDSRSVQRSLFGEEPIAPAADPSAIAAYHVHRIRPPVKAHGGKYYLAPKIVPILLNVRAKVTEYLEPCAFGASVFLAMPRMKREILGDINPDVVALWTVLSNRESAAELTRRLAAVPYTEETFEAAKRETGVTLIERATRFLIRCRFSRGGLGKDFAWSERMRGGRPGDENAWHTFRENELPRVIARAEGTEVLSDPCWRTVWESRNAIQRLIYADPPYMPKTRTAKTAYGPFEMTPYQHARLVTALRAHSGPAAISGYWCDEYDRWLRDWRRFDFEMPNNAGQSRRKQRRCESLWTNW